MGSRTPRADRTWSTTRSAADGLATILTNACAAGGPGIADAVCAGVEQYRAGWPVEDDATAFVVSVR